MHNILPLLVVSAAAICFFTLINTDFGLGILILSMLLSPEFVVGNAAGRAVVLRIDDVLLLVVFFTWMAKLAMNKQMGLLRHTVLNLPIAVYVATLIIATLLGWLSGKVNILKSSFYILKYIEYFMLFFMVTNNIKNRKQIRIFVFLLLAVCLITSIYAITTAAEYGRATAPFEQAGPEGGGEPNTLGGYLVLIFGITAGILLYTKSLIAVLPLGGLAVLILYTLLQTLSRGSYLAFMAMFIVLVIFSARKKFILLAMVVVFLFVWRTALPSKVKHRVSETFAAGKVYQPFRGTRITLDESASARVESWKVVYDKWKYKPVFGYGVTGVGFIDTQYPLILGEAGIAGLLAFFWLIAVIFRESLAKLILIKDNYFSGLTLGFLAAFVGLLIHSFSAATFIIIRIMEPFWFLAAIVMVLPEIKREEEGLQVV